MLKISIFLTFVAMSQACKVSSTYNWATVEEQAQKAGVVFKATVNKVIGNVNSSTITVKNIEYYKGCGPKRGTIKGFRSSAACGIDMPTKNEKKIFFLCADGDGWILNEIAVFTGAIDATQDNIDKVEKETENELRCAAKCGCSFYKKCLKRAVEQ